MSLAVLLHVGAVPFQPKEQKPPASTVKYSDEYVRYLEQVIAQLGSAFAHVVHHNPPEMASNPLHGRRPPLPDLVLSAKSPAVCAADLRARRGLPPLSCRLESCGPSPSVTPSVSPDLATPSTATFSFCDDVLSPTPTLTLTPALTAGGDESRDAWRRVGRDLRQIADSFSVARAPAAQPVASTGDSWFTAVVAFVWSALVRRFFL